jgi:hypothetical protein
MSLSRLFEIGLALMALGGVIVLLVIIESLPLGLMPYP